MTSIAGTREAGLSVLLVSKTFFQNSIFSRGLYF